MNPSDKDILISKWLADELSESERLDLEALASSDLKLLEQSKSIWAAAQSYQPEVSPLPSSWSRVITEISKDQVRPKPRLLSWPMKIAASMLLLCSAYILTQILGTPGQDLSEHIAQSTNEKIELSDGSVIWLNQDAILRYPERFSGQSRTVTLDGEAFFDIIPSKTPFMIVTPTSEVTVLGTTFEVESSEQQTEVTVATGKVQLSSTRSGESITIKAHEKGLHDVSAQKITRSKVADLNDISWHTGFISFNQTPLSDVVTQLSEISGQDIQILNKAMMACRYTSPLTDTDVHKTIQVIAKAFNFKVDKSNDQIILSNGVCQ